MTRTLGLDIGSNSVGWALIDEAAGNLLAIGVRVFPEGVGRDTSGAEHSQGGRSDLGRNCRRGAVGAPRERTR